MTSAPVSGAHAAAIARPGARGPDGRLREAAEAFEAILVQSMLESMTQAQLDEGFFGAASGASGYEAMFLDGLSRTAAQRSPLGIADALVARWGGAAGAVPSATPHARAVPEARVRPLPRPVAPPPTAPADGVSSRFGWRRDPIDGASAFHAGVDVPAESGTRVLAVAPGRIEVVGRHGAYGLEVVVGHADGWKTRYAHLEVAEVVIGQFVARGTTIGRVGRTGRATGSHLHFEALLEGRRIDPELAAPGPLPPQVLGPAPDEKDVREDPRSGNRSRDRRSRP